MICFYALLMLSLSGGAGVVGDGCAGAVGGGGLEMSRLTPARRSTSTLLY
jgi:hypothetical protein